MPTSVHYTDLISSLVAGLGSPSFPELIYGYYKSKTSPSSAVVGI